MCDVHRQFFFEIYIYRENYSGIDWNIMVKQIGYT